LGDGNDFALGRRFDAAWCRRVAIQGKVRPGMVVVPEIPGQDAIQMGLVEYDHPIQTIAAYRTDDSFTIGIFPRRSGRDRDILDAHVPDPLLEVVANPYSFLFSQTERLGPAVEARYLPINVNTDRIRRTEFL
jgi:hypothetical protein